MSGVIKDSDRIYVSDSDVNKSSDSEGFSIEESIHEGKTWSVKNPTAAMALKFTAIGLIATLIIGALVGIGATGGFGPHGWLQQTALPAIKEAFENFADWVVNTVIPAIRDFLNTIPDLNVWQGLAYIAAPIVGAMIIGGVTYKYIIPCAKQMHAEHQQKKAEQDFFKQARAVESSDLTPEQNQRYQDEATIQKGRRVIPGDTKSSSGAFSLKWGS